MYIQNSQPKSMQFDSAYQRKQEKRNWNVFFAEWKSGKYNFDELSEEEKEYIKQHDATYSQLFL